jgi:tRNA (guanine-N(7)-)-methyltransferase subunit TRM82
MSSSHPLSSTLHSIVTDSSNLTSPQTLSQLNLYPDLSLFPRWPGLEEDDDLAGPAPTAEAPAEIQTGGPVFPKKEYTQSEYEAMNLKHLGRLKAQGYDVEGVMRVKRRETKDRRFEAKRARLEAGLSEPSKDEMELAEEEGVEDEEAGNA